MSRVWFAPVSFGLGDLVVSLPPLHALIASAATDRDDVWLVARSRSQALLAERIDGLAGCIAEELFDRDNVEGQLVDLRDHSLQRDWWWGSAEFEAAFGRLSINDILDRICADCGIAADFSRPVPLRSLPRTNLSSVVALVAETDGPAKSWPPQHWREIAATVRAHGLEPRVVTPDERGSVHGIDSVCAPTPGDAVDVLSAARAVVGVDTGLTHIAAQQRTPTVTIARHDGVYVRVWPHTRVVTGDACDEACRAVEREYAYNRRVDLRSFEWRPRQCPVDGRCMDSVRVDDVVRALEELV